MGHKARPLYSHQLRPFYDSALFESRPDVQWAFPFNKPVDVNTYRDYLTRVTTPMDFGTIKRKLDAGHYPAPELFAVDMRQVFTNAHTYNAPGTDVWSMANTLKVG